jgi:GT2 family glycosyltransferase
MIKKTKIKASIIILNYFGEKIIKETIESVLKLNYPKENFELIIVDNNSKDNSKVIIDKFEKNYKNIRSLFLDKNLGFAGGNNKGINIANGEYIILLNNDCIVDKNWLKELVLLVDKDKNIFSVGSKIKQHPAILNSVQNAGSIVFQDGYGRDIGSIVTYERNQFYEKDIKQFNSSKEIYSTCGAAVLYRSSILNKIGNLDESFFMYYEDTEISERARLSGYTNYYCPKAIVYHHHAKSSNEWSPFFVFNTEKGRLLHMFYHFPSYIFIKEYFLFTIKSILRIFKNILHSNKSFVKDLQYIKVSLFFISNLFKIFLVKNKYLSLTSKEEIQQNYQKLLSGYWYFN